MRSSGAGDRALGFRPRYHACMLDTPVSGEPFVPGGFWTPERARAAAAAMTAEWEKPEVQSLIEAVAQEVNGLGGEPPPPAALSTRPRRDAVRYRRGREADVPALAALIAAADLPPLFIAEFLGGFAVAEHAGDLVACGGLEMYDDGGVIRSVVVHPEAQGLGLGRVVSELLIEDARLSGAGRAYLFTAEAAEFWRHLGFEDLLLADWSMPPRASWQYRYVSEHRGEMAAIGVRGMWRALT
jgi:amino-acid N-acetyltransferase